MLSAALMYWGVTGNYKVTVQEIITIDGIIHSRHPPTTNPLLHTYQAFRQLVSYLWECGFGLLVFAKASASCLWGIEDIVNAEFSTVFTEDGEEDEEASSWHMGLLFSAIGAGCMTGPVLINYFTNAQRPYTLQRAHWIGLCFLTGGWFAISAVRDDSFGAFLICTLFRSMGSGISWVNSTVLLQALSEKQVLGRVLAVDYTLMTLLEAASATASGNLADAGYSKNQLALFGAFLGMIVVSVWGVYYSLSLGAAHPRFNQSYCYESEQVAEEDEDTITLEL
jgi:hypothetical protein